MMSDRAEEELDIFESRKALAAAEFAEVQVAAVVGAAARNSREVRTIVEKNGYVERFRAMLQGVT